MKTSLLVLVFIICISISALSSAYFVASRLNAEHEKDLMVLTSQLSVCIDNYNDSEELVEHLKLVQRLMDDGASLKQAEQIIEVSEEAGISPKL